MESISSYVRELLINIHKNEVNLHMGSTLSCVEILTVLLTKYVKRSSNPLEKDWLILSKGHAAPALYALLALEGLIPYEELFKMQSIDSMLQGHPDTSIAGVDVSTGSLGQGLSIGVGIATWIKLRGGSGRVYIVMGDGEQDEGEVWEAITHAVVRKLSNLIVIVDDNGYQLDGRVCDIKPKYFMPFIWSTIGWAVILCNGHSVSSLISAIDRALVNEKPTVIFAKTVRGKGLKQIEGTDIQRVELWS